MLLLIDRFIRKVIRFYRKALFKKNIGCKHNDFNLVGKVNLINRNITLGRNVTIYPDVMFWGNGPIDIGDNVDIGNGTIIYSSENGGITIGNDTVIAAQCYIIDMDHGIKRGKLVREQENNAKPVIIGNDVWLGANVTVLKGSNIGSGAVVGAKALVKGEIFQNAIAVGIPAQIIRYRE